MTTTPNRKQRLWSLGSCALVLWPQANYFAVCVHTGALTVPPARVAGSTGLINHTLRMWKRTEQMASDHGMAQAKLSRFKRRNRAGGTNLHGQLWRKFNWGCTVVGLPEDKALGITGRGHWPWPGAWCLDHAQSTWWLASYLGPSISDFMCWLAATR